MKLETIYKELKAVKAELTEIKQLASDVMNAETAAKFLGIGKSTLDKITRPDNMIIPVAKIGGKKKIFLRKDLINYIEKHRAA